MTRKNKNKLIHTYKIQFVLYKKLICTIQNILDKILENVLTKYLNIMSNTKREKKTSLCLF